MDKPANAWARSKAIAPSIITTHFQFFKKIISINFLYFPDGPVVMTPHFHHKGHMFNPWLGIDTDMGTPGASFAGFPGGSDNKESVYNAGAEVRSRGWEDPLAKGMGTHCSILPWRISMDRGVWWTTAHGVTRSDTTECLTQSLSLQGEFCESN